MQGAGMNVYTCEEFVIRLHTKSYKHRYITMITIKLYAYEVLNDIHCIDHNFILCILYVPLYNNTWAIPR